MLLREYDVVENGGTRKDNIIWRHTPKILW